MLYQSKQPGEKIPLEIDLANSLPEGESLAASGHTISATDSAAQDVTNALLSSVSVTSPKVLVVIEPSVAGTYKLRFLMKTSPTGYFVEEDVTLIVKEK
jgi:hypothetical protein